MSVSKDMQALREMLGVGTNAEVIVKVAEMQSTPEPPTRYIVTVAWTEGAPANTAQVTILQPEKAPILTACEALRAGEAVLNTQLASIAAQAVARAEGMQKQLQEVQDAKRVKERVDAQGSNSDKPAEPA